MGGIDFDWGGGGVEVKNKPLLSPLWETFPTYCLNQKYNFWSLGIDSYYLSHLWYHPAVTLVKNNI